MRREAQQRQQGGWSLIELITACSVAGVLAMISAPSFQTIALNTRRTTEVNALVQAVHTARAAAIQRAVPVVLCRSRDGAHCAQGDAQWNEGWIVFANDDRNSPPQVDDGEDILLRQPASDLSIRANRDHLIYWPVSMAGSAMSFVICDRRGSAAARTLIISPTGRPRVSGADGSGRPLNCPGQG